MPLSSSEQEQAKQAYAADAPLSLTTTEIMAFQIVAQRLKIILSALIELAEIRQQNPYPPLSLLDDMLTHSLSPIQSPVSTNFRIPSIESATHGIPEESRHTIKTEGERGYAAMERELFTSPTATYSEEKHQFNSVQSKYDLAAFQSKLGC